MIEFTKYITNQLKGDTISDEIADFFDLIMGNHTRWQAFRRYIEINYKANQYNKILDIGCGPCADLSLELLKKNYDVTAIDPRVKHINNLKTIKKCFDYTTDVAQYDLLVGLEPCNATEHIILSAKENNKAFCIKLCASPHAGIKGQKFETRQDWYNYLLKVADGYAILEEKNILGKQLTIIKNNN